MYTCSLDSTVKIWDERAGFVDHIFLEEQSQPWGIGYMLKNDDIIVGLESGDVLFYEGS